MRIARRPCVHRYRTKTVVPRPRSNRRIAAAAKAIQREKDLLPLFAADVTTTVEERLDRTDLGDQACCDFWRRHRAMNWRRVRRALFALSSEFRTEILNAWNACGWPKDPEYLSCMIRRECTRAGVSFPGERSEV